MTTQDPRYKHKPSEKHTLEEVLKSLQDLVRNDLPGEKSAGNKLEPPPADPDHGGQKPPETGGQKPARERPAPVREDFAPVNPATGPVNLDAVMRSLKDLIGNELNVGDQPATEENLTPPLPEEGILESAAEDLAPLQEEPAFEEPDELNLGDELASPEEDFTPPLPEEDILESAAANLAPLQEEPTFEEPDELDLGDELASPEEDILASAAEEPAPLHDEPTLEESRELAPPEETPASPPAQPAAADGSSKEFILPDEELTFDKTAAAPATAPAAPEIPGEISPELLAEPVAATPPAAPKTSEEGTATPGTQQELLFDEPAPLIIERQPPSQELGKQTEMKPEPVPENPAADVPGEPATQNLEAAPEEALPTIEVEETFDDSAYFDVDVPHPESTPPEEIVAPAVEPPVAAEPTAAESTDSAGERPGSIADTAPALKTASSKTESKLEIAEEPSTKTPRDPATVDFDSIDLTPPEEAPPSSVPVETTAPATSEPPKTEQSVPSMPSIDFETVSLDSGKDKQTPTPAPEAAPPARASEPPAAVEAPAAPESAQQEVNMTEKPAPDEIEKEAAVEPEPEKAPEKNAAAPASAGKKHKKETTQKPAAAAKPPAFNLDDIPVLHEVVAPPAGSMLAPPPAPPAPAAAPLPAPDRARDIVVRAVAKLNVEMRKSGGAGLDTKTILRLQKLIRQELEKDGKK